MLDFLTLFWISSFTLILYKIPHTRHSSFFTASLVLGIILGSIVILFPLKINETYGLLLILLTLIIGYVNRNFLEKSNDQYKSGILHTIINEDRLLFLIPSFGILLLFSHSIAVQLYTDGHYGTLDRLIVLQALSWILYNYINTQYLKEKDFIFLFLNSLSIFFIFPALIVYLVDGNQDPYLWTNFINILLAEPLGKLLNLLGFVVIVENDTISYQDTVSGKTTMVWVSKGCSGINSVIIFLSAYISYLISSNRLKYHMVFLVVFGILISYVANLIRMTMIIIIGHYYGVEALVWTHENIGWVIFTIWMLIFWKLSSYFEEEISKSNILSP